MTDEAWENDPDFFDEDDAADQPRNHATRFGAGQEHNALGRPKGSKGTHAIVRKVANQRMAVIEGGKTRRMNWLAILLTTIRNKAVLGDQRWIALYDRALMLSHPVESGIARGVLIVPESYDTPEEWILAVQRRRQQQEDDLGMNE